MDGSILSLYLLPRVELMSSAGKTFGYIMFVQQCMKGYQGNLEHSPKIGIHMQLIFYSHCGIIYRRNI